MSIEKDLTRIADNLARIADALEQRPSPTPENVIRIDDRPQSKPAAANTVEPAANDEALVDTDQPITLEIAREALKSVAAKYGKDVARKLLDQYGATKLPDLKPTDYEALYDDCQAQLQDKAA